MKNLSDKPNTVFAPTNIAFLKYWGKSDPKKQWPSNSSISMTLNELGSTTSAQICDGDHRFRLNDVDFGADNSKGQKVFQHIERIQKHFKTNFCFDIQSYNNFPTGSGIASSASGMAALTLAVARAITNAKDLSELLELVGGQQIAHWMIQGSGSAGRSLYGGYVEWIRGVSAEDMRVEVYQPESHWVLHDLIVLFSEDEKTISSSEAHLAAQKSLLFAPRIAGVEQRMNAMKGAISERDIHKLGPLLEAECLEMHAVMMTADPAVSYFGQPSAQFLCDLREFRNQTQCGVYFTIDAGANIHAICDPQSRDQFVDWLGSRKFIEDTTGKGPRFL